MAFTLNFQSLEEKVPEHGKRILFFDTKVDMYGFQSGDLKSGEVFYIWDNGNGTSWVYDGEKEFVYEDGETPGEDENIHLVFCIGIDGEGTAGEYGPVSNIKPYFSKRIFWTDYDEFWNTLPTDGT
jgi:hypothetical protein